MNKVDIKDIVEISRLAGLEILKIYKQDFEVFNKDDESPLTMADKNANDIIIAKLQTLYPEIPYISEEVKNLDYSERKKWEYCWIIDPLDGTKEFVKKNGEFTVNIALVKNGKPVLGVVYIPVEDTYFFAEENKGAFKQIGNNEPVLLEKKADVLNKQKLKVVASRSHLSKEVEQYVENLKTAGKEIEFVSAGSSLKFCLVAEGKADIYPRLAPTMEWDTAAAHIVCTEAGIIVVDNETKEELKYNKEDLLNPYFIVK